MPSALAIFAHPDDIEFVAAGTLLLLRDSGFDTHYMNLADGCGGSAELGPEAIAKIRLAEAQSAAAILGASFHPPISPDLEITYSIPLHRKIAAVVRAVRPQIILTHSPQDYMEDHMFTSRLAVTAAFTRCIQNFQADPPTDAFFADLAIYHALPHGLCDALRQPVAPDFFVDTSSVQDTKSRALAAHASQKDWLDRTQGMGSYLAAMDEMSQKVGTMSGHFKHAEGWRRHSHLGFAPESFDPLTHSLNPTLISPNPHP